MKISIYFQKLKQKTALIHNFYLSRNISFPYIKTSLTVLLIILIHISLLFNVFNIFDYLPVWHINNVEIPRSIAVMFFGFFLLFIFFFLFKKKNLSQYNFSENELIADWKNLIVYNGIVLVILIIIINLYSM